MSEEKKTEMVASQAGKAKLVKIKAVQAIRVSPNVEVQPGTVVEVSEEVAVEFCDRKFLGSYPFGGQRSSQDAKRAEIVRAVRVA